MVGEDASVTTRVYEEGGLTWVKAYIHGVVLPRSVDTRSKEDAERVRGSIQEIVAEAYRCGYRMGFRACGKVIRDAIGD